MQSRHTPCLGPVIWQAFYSSAQTVSLTGTFIFHTTPEAQPHTFPPSPWWNLYLTDKKLVWRILRILNLFKTHFRLRVNSPCLRPWHSFLVSLWSRSFFLRWITADPSPWGKFTPPAKQQCGETLGDLEPVYDLLLITSEFTFQRLWHRQACGVFAKRVVFLTVNHRGPLPLKNFTPPMKQ